ncbi:hypothetical protein [Azospirillum sp. Sh1]|uniref:hypothetical protein n=1 Tax=Azospirillum sp. Sh1 TaxID=2607285 RepID=UPI0011ED8FE6|nr:hypothetical protein [Azospirillum sp. Sh1]KAA0573029.1 hypothetical protein FZ029_21705 [Azospirillum sp. Sh1]
MRGVECSENVRFLRPAFEVFLNNLERFGHSMEWGTLAYHYNERATVSLFSAACWQTGMVALEEYISSKKNGDDRYHGRADMWAYCPVTGQDIAIEAKQAWVGLGTGLSTITKKIEEADREADKNEEAKIYASLTFLVPSLDADISRNDVVELFRRIHDHVLELNIDALAWWLPEEASGHRSRNRKNEKMTIWPGVLAVMRVVRMRGRGNRISSKKRLHATAWSLVPSD